MPKRKLFLPTLAALLLVVAALFGYLRWRTSDPAALRVAMLTHMPAEATAVVFLDLAEFRSSPFLAQVFAWAPHPPPDQEYIQFVQATGFNYERDLDRVALAITRQSPRSTFLAIADGRFDRNKIEAYARSAGKQELLGGKVIFSLALKGSSRPSFFAFLRDDRIAWTDDPSYAVLLFAPRSSGSFSREWWERFTRLAGTPVFALVRQDSEAVSSFAQQAPGGFRSPQLASLLNQLQWISIGGKPDGNLLRVVIDAECPSEGTIRQLNDVLNGMVILAQGGLNDPKTRKQLDPQLREACLELLRSTDIQKIDRGPGKSVRVVFDITPKLLESAHAATSAAPPEPSPTPR
jgi:hypothetical protein